MNSFSQRDSWQERGGQQHRERMSRDFRRSAIVVSILVLVGFLFRFLFPPFFAPTTTVVLVGSGVNSTFHTPDIPFVSEDQQAFEAIEGVAVTRAEGGWKTKLEADELGERINSLALDESDTLIVHLSAHGVSSGGDAYLLCDDFDVHLQSNGLVPIEMILQQVSQSSAGVKLLIINAGSLDYDPRIGMIVNDFPRLLDEAVNNTKDPSLWVYCSHGPAQYSHSSLATRRSVFGMFVGEGLKGAADLNRDRAVNLDELVAFASANVSRWVKQFSQGEAVQTPQLSWGGVGDFPEASPRLLTLSANAAPHVFSVVNLIEAANKRVAATEDLQRRSTSLGVMSRRQQDVGNGAEVSTTPSQSAANDGDPASAGEPGQDGASPNAAADDATGGGAPAGQAPAKQNKQPKRLLAKAWSLRDELISDEAKGIPGAEAMARMPHLLREYEAELLAFERRLASGDDEKADQIREILEQSLPKTNPEDPAKEKSSVDTMREVAGLTMAGDLAIPEYTVHTLALAEALASLGDRELDSVDMDALQATLTQETRKPFEEWVKKHQPKGDRNHYEWRFLNRLAADEGLDWGLMQVAATTCLQAERVAALDVAAPGWIREKVERADQLRYFAEELLFDRIGPNWEERAREAFQRASLIYGSAEEDFGEILSAQQMRDRVIARVPGFLRWRRRVSDTTGGVDTRSLDQLLSRLTELSNQLENKDSPVEAVVRTRDNLERTASLLEIAASDNAIQRLVERTSSLGDAWRMQQLLETPLVSGAARQQLSSAVNRVDRELSASYEPAQVTTPMPGTVIAAPSEDYLTPGKWEEIFQLAKLDAAFVKLGSISNAEADPPKAVARHVNESRRVAKAFDELAARHEQVTSAVDDSTTSQPGSADTKDLWDAYANFGEAMEAYYDRLTVPGPSGACDQQLVNLAHRSLRIADARDAGRFREADLFPLTAISNLKSSLAWQASRLEQAAAFARSDEVKLFAEASEAYANQREQLCRVADLEAAADIEINVGPTIDLQYANASDPACVLTVELKNRSKSPSTFHLALDFDQSLVRVAPCQADAQQSRPQSFDQDSLARLSDWVSEPIQLDAGDSEEWSFRVARNHLASLPTKIGVAVLQTASQNARQSRRENTLLSRKTVDVILPVGELFVDETAGVRSMATNAWRLYPYPNRQTQFRIGVINQSTKPKNVSLALYALDRPFAGLSVEVFAELALGAKPLMESKISVPGDGKAAYPAMAKPAEKKDVAKPDAGGAAPGAKPEEAEPAPTPPSLELKHGLLAAIRDQDTGQVTYRHLDFMVQRPRRFVEPHVSFDADRQRIVIKVGAIKGALPTLGAPVRVDCQLAAPPPGGLEGKLQDTLVGPEDPATLFINMPSIPLQPVRLYIGVDGYPRAFIYDVVCGKHIARVPEKTSLAQVRLASSNPSGVIAATKDIPVFVEVDAPVGSFEGTRDQVQVGVDLNGRGAPDPETAIELTSDRSVRMGFVKALPGGAIDVISEVADFELALPADRLENVRLDVAGNLIVAGQDRDSTSIALQVDSAPPIVGPVEPTNFRGFVPVGAKLELSVWAWDLGCRVKRVEAAFDEGSGEFPEAGGPMQGDHEGGRKWALVADVGAKPGQRVLLVRAVDEVGNPSDPLRVPVNVVSAAVGAALVQQQKVKLTGIVTLGENPAPDAAIKLIKLPEDPATPPPAPQDADGVVRMSDEMGKYSIPGVSPGKYLLYGKAVIRNRVRLVKQEVVVAPGPARTIQVDLVLK